MIVVYVHGGGEGVVRGGAGVARASQFVARAGPRAVEERAVRGGAARPALNLLVVLDDRVTVARCRRG